MSAEVLSFEQLVRERRGPDVEAERKRRIRAQWHEARIRAYHGMENRADVGLFGAELIERCRAANFDPLQGWPALTFG